MPLLDSVLPVKITVAPVELTVSKLVPGKSQALQMLSEEYDHSAVVIVVHAVASI